MQQAHEKDIAADRYRDIEDSLVAEAGQQHMFV